MATSKIYLASETPKVKGTDFAWTMEGVSYGAGRVSAQIDLSAAPRADFYRLDISAMWQATPVQYQALEIFGAFAPETDNTMVDGDVGVVDAALGSIAQTINMQPLGPVLVESADTTKMKSSFNFKATGRYLSLVGVNNGGATLDATPGNFVAILTPIPSQGQAT